MRLSFIAKTKRHLEAQIGVTGLQQVTIMFVAASLTNLLAYVFNIGRMLPPVSSGILVSLQAMLVILIIAWDGMQTVVARYVSRFEAIGQRERITKVVTYSLRRVIILAGFPALVLVLARSLLAQFLQIASPVAVIVLAFALIPTMVASTVYGLLQGLQRFGPLGAMQVSVGTLRIILGILFVYMGFDAVGAIAALPASSGIIALLALFSLRTFLQDTQDREESDKKEPFLYSFFVIITLTCFAILTNLDMIMVKHFFPPPEAGWYAAAATLGKIVFFFLLAVARVLLPKSSQRYALNQDTSDLVRFSLLAVAIPSGLLTLVYFLQPSLILSLVFGDQYVITGPLIGILGVAMTLYGLINIWLCYYLSVKRTSFLYRLSVGVLLQLMLLACFHSSLLQVATVLVITALAVFAAGEFIFQRRWPGRP